MIIKRPLYRVRSSPTIKAAATDAMLIWSMVRKDLDFLFAWSAERRAQERAAIVDWIAANGGFVDDIAPCFTRAVGLGSAAITLSLVGHPVGAALFSDTDDTDMAVLRLIMGELNDSFAATEFGDLYGYDLQSAPDTWQQLFIFELCLTSDCILSRCMHEA